jgi:predicted  nucleic acid-binding Zn-ribbon protein
VGSLKRKLSEVSSKISSAKDDSERRDLESKKKSIEDQIYELEKKISEWERKLSDEKGMITQRLISYWESEEPNHADAISKYSRALDKCRGMR